MRVLVTGAEGQLGSELVRLSDGGCEVVGYGRADMDVTDLDAARARLQAVRPDAVIHCAAYTDVDRAQDEVDRAFRVNAAGSRNVAVAASEVGARVCHISTDYVFDGALERPYREFDATRPASVYGQSKLAAEVLVQTLCPRYFIVRTSWLYGASGSNFVKTMLRMGRERDAARVGRGAVRVGRDAVRVVDDQRGSPTYAADLARFLLELVGTDQYGVYHASNTGRCSWYEFACAIFEEAGVDTPIEPCTTEEFSRPAPRPRNSVLDHVAIRTNGFDELPPWRDALRRFLAEMGELKAQ